MRCPSSSGNWIRPVWFIMRVSSMTAVINDTSDMESQMYTSAEDIKKFLAK